MLRRIPKPVAIPVTSRVVAKALPSKVPPSIVADVLQQHHVEPDRQSRYTLETYMLHVSDIIQTETARKFCARERVLGYLSNKKPVLRGTTPGMSLIHTMGHGLQDHLTERFINDSPYGHTVWGDWVCWCYRESKGAKGTVVRHSLRPHAVVCNECHGPVVHYKEVDLAIPSLRLGGHPDLLLLWNGVLIVYEIKTIERVAIDFNTLDAPLGDHTFQATFYYWIMRRMYEDGLLPYPPFEELRYVYIDRSTSKIMGGRVYKEFVKLASPAKRVQDRLATSVTIVNTAVETRRLPSRICASPDDTRAKACRACVDCFSRKQVAF